MGRGCFWNKISVYSKGVWLKRCTGFYDQGVSLFQLFAGERTYAIVVDVPENETTFVDVARLGRDEMILKKGWWLPPLCIVVNAWG